MGSEGHGVGERHLAVFGPCAIVDGGLDSRLSTAQRRLLERLALAAPRPLSLEHLYDAIWEGDPPRHARATVQNQVSRLRAAWGEEIIITTADGYALGYPTDAQRLRDLSAEAEVLLESGDAPAAFELATSVLPLWVGTPYASLDHLDIAQAARRALSASHKAAENTRLGAGLALGRSGWALHEAERLAADSPHDERRQALLARALALAGRRGDALAAISSARRRLRADLGIDAGPDLSAVEYEILNPTAPKVGSRTLSFVGRGQEVRIALASLARGDIVRVHGEPGSGVTRLLSEIGTYLRRLGVRTTQIDASEHLDSAVSLLEAIADGVGLDSDESRGLVTGFADAATRAAQGAPLAILVDNAEVVGPSAQQALANAAAPRVLIVLGGHVFPTEEASGVVDLPLPGLDRASIAQLAAETAQGPVDPAQLDRLHAFTGGNALALEIMLASGMHDPDELHADEAGVVSRLDALSTELLRGLTPTAIALIERAAVAGDGYPMAVLTKDSAVIPDRLVARTPTGGVNFRHGALRNAVYHRIPPARREELHAELGRDARAAGSPAALVARHLVAAGPLAQPEAAAACQAAASDASRHGAHADAVEWLTVARGLDCLDAHAQIALQVRLGDAERLLGEPGHLDTLTAAVRAALDLGEEHLISEACFALLQLGGTTASGAPPGDLPDLVERVLSALREPGPKALVSAAASLTWSLTGQATRSRALFDEAEHLASDDATRARVLPFAYMSLGLPEDLGRRRLLAEELLAIGTRIDDPVARFEAWQQKFSIALQDADGVAVRDAVAQMTALIDRVGDVGRRWSLQFARAGVAHLDGDDEAAERLSADAAALFGPVSPSRAAAAHGGQLIALRLTQGRMGELEPLVGELVAAQPGLPAWHAAYALATADPGDRLKHARLALERTEPDLTWLAAHVIGGRAAAMTGDTTLAGDYLHRLLPWSGRGVWQGTCSYGPVDTVIALLQRLRGDDAAAMRHLDVARGVADRLEAAPYLVELDAITAPARG